MSELDSFKNVQCQNWTVSELDSVKMTENLKVSELMEFGKCQNWTVSELDSVKIGQCQNWTVSKLDSVRIGKCQNWKVFMIA